VSFTIDSTGILRRARRPPAQFAFAAGLALYFAYHLISHLVWPLVPSGDASIIFDLPREIFRQSDYPARPQSGNIGPVFPYPPAAVMLFRALGICGPHAFMAAWIILLMGGLLVTFRASVAGENGDVRAAWLLLAPITRVRRLASVLGSAQRQQ
jgi:hypothetical protein